MPRQLDFLMDFFLLISRKELGSFGFAYLSFLLILDGNKSMCFWEKIRIFVKTKPLCSMKKRKGINTEISFFGGREGEKEIIFLKVEKAAL